MQDPAIMNQFSLEGKTALVTGGCYGIGYAIAKALHGAGARIVINASRQSTIDKALEDYAADGICDVKAYVCDVTDEAAVREMIDDIEKTVAPLDILVNNAGIIKRIPMCEMSVEDFRRVVDVDLDGALHRGKGRSARHDRARSRQDHQRGLDPQRCGPRNRCRLHRRRGRI